MKKFLLTSFVVFCILLSFAGPRLDSSDYHHHSSGGGGGAVILLIILGLMFMFRGNKKK